MRTTLDIEDELLDALMARMPDKSKTAAIEEAIAKYLARDAAEGIRQLAGSVEVDDVSAEMRASDRKE